MPCDFLQYYVIATNIRLHEEVSCLAPNSLVKEIRLSPKDNEDIKQANTTILVRCLFDSISDQAVAEFEASKAISLLFGKLSYTYTNAIFSEPFFSYMYSKGQISTSSDLYSTLTVRARLDIRSIENITLDENHILLYRLAHSINNDSLRLTILYGLFQELVSKRLSVPGRIHGQSTVDRIIFYWQNQRNIPTIWKKSSKNETKPETIYTWLRNQIGHSQAESYKHNIHSQISHHINEFVTLIKKAL